MMSPPHRAIDMEHPSRWLAVLRIVVGLYFAKALWQKLTLVLVGGVFPLPGASSRWLAVMPQLVAKQAAENPLGFYKDFLENTVLTHAPLFANLTAWGEALVGLGLTFGLLTGLASVAGLVLAISYGMATQWMSPGQRGFHLVLVTCMLVFFLARAGRAWGLDGWLAWRFPESFLTKRPFS